jgi:uncharacterized membrane protein YbhN (UPF0104 family)
MSESDPRPPAVERFESEERETPWGWLGAAAIAVIVAVLCFTPIWDEVTDSSGRRAGFARLLGTLGPVTVAGVALAFAVLALVLALRARRRPQR